ncbi:solute carrier family 43 member 3-like isoform X2 [Pecten maximus]|uniref:solute carrier family 43 member 3-like isoform X2 n=1 Tax=Pecten maximus TaxID=6579 RepID=UPI0014589934|nr:solute carrier family 43 member 3-like isoform X2 [Pecten maximus]
MINARRVALVSVSLLEIFIFGGMQFGWFALVFILKQEGVLKNLCVTQQFDNSTEEISHIEDCFPQDEQFNLIFSIGIAIFTVLSVVNGQLYQSFDIKRIRMIYIEPLVCTTRDCTCGDGRPVSAVIRLYTDTGLSSERFLDIYWPNERLL